MENFEHPQSLVPELRLLRMSEDVELPTYAHPGDAGLDLRSAISCTLAPFERKLIPTGIKIAVPAGYAGLVMPRSGNALKRGLSIPNTPGLIDSGYRGEIQVIVINLDPTAPLVIEPGDKIAQLVITPTPQVKLVAVDELDDTSRGEQGFGSTGL